MIQPQRMDWSVLSMRQVQRSRASPSPLPENAGPGESGLRIVLHRPDWEFVFRSAKGNQQTQSRMRSRETTVDGVCLCSARGNKLRTLPCRETQKGNGRHERVSVRMEGIGCSSNAGRP